MLRTPAEEYESVTLDKRYIGNRSIVSVRDLFLFRHCPYQFVVWNRMDPKTQFAVAPNMVRSMAVCDGVKAKFGQELNVSTSLNINDWARRGMRTLNRVMRDAGIEEKRGIGQQNVLMERLNNIYKMFFDDKAPERKLLHPQYIKSDKIYDIYVRMMVDAIYYSVEDQMYELVFFINTDETISRRAAIDICRLQAALIMEDAKAESQYKITAVTYSNSFGFKQNSIYVRKQHDELATQNQLLVALVRHFTTMPLTQNWMGCKSCPFNCSLIKEV